MINDISRVLLTEEQIRSRVAQLGEELAKDYEGKTPIFVGILKGAITFFSDVVRATPIPCEYDFMAVSSYGAATISSGKIDLIKDLGTDIKGRHVVILEDILDTGHTLKFVTELLAQREPASVKLCVLLDKPERREVPIYADYIGFTIPNEFVVGYGLDYNEVYRNIPFVGVLDPKVYKK
ncbi:MAG: hypoxanthine phosphoribosyltransferase [Oscillospiraceae bacterium]|nr:hypoxanthine phosphoribosyltransferase [Oscillospiraceae bacterium]